MAKYRKYLPWALSLIAGLIAIWSSTQPADVVTVPGVPYAVPSKPDTVTVEVKKIVPGRTIVLHDSSTKKDTVRIMYLVARRDTINREIAALGETRADIDTAVHVNLGAGNSADVRIVGVWNIESGLYDLAVSIVNLNVSSGSTWQWIERAAILAVGILSRLIL